ncbi:MAG: hypothetical protein WCI94_16650 [Rhodospirillales bacterium]
MSDARALKTHANDLMKWGDDDDCAWIDRGNFGLQMPIPSFVTLVDALIVVPPQPAWTAGRNGATDAGSSIYWTYSREGGLHLAATPGFMSTASGDGGFTMTVDPSGEWKLHFDGTNKTIGSEHDDDAPTGVPLPPAGNAVVTIPGTGAASYNASAGHLTVNGGLGWDTISGGVGDYMIGGAGTLGGGLAGRGNCAVYSSSSASILVDMENGFGYGGNAEGNVYVNINQVRGSLGANVLIGNSHGSDLKSGGNNSVLISTGGNAGFEMRPDGRGNVLVSTIGADRVVFDPTHGWKLGYDNLMLGFNIGHGDTLDLRMLLDGTAIKQASGPNIVSNFHTSLASGYNAATGTGDISAYLAIDDRADGSHVIFSPTGNVAAGGTDILSLSMVHGITTQSLNAAHALMV